MAITGTWLSEQTKSRTQWTGGRLLHIHIAPAASLVMEEIEEANLVTGRGIEGDRYFLGTGTYSRKPDVFREVTLFEMEVLEALDFWHKRWAERVVMPSKWIVLDYSARPLLRRLHLRNT